MHQVMKALVLAALAAGAAGWASRVNVGSDSRGNPLTCGGAVMSEQIKKNIRGENADVPVSLIARYPFLVRRSRPDSPRTPAFPRRQLLHFLVVSSRWPPAAYRIPWSSTSPTFTCTARSFS